MTTLFYAKISRVSQVRAVTDTGTGDEKRIGEVPTLDPRKCTIYSFIVCKCAYKILK